MKKKSAVEIYNDEPMVGTFLISQGFERKHKQLIKLIEEYRTQFEGFTNNKSFSKGLIKRRVPAKTAGRPVEEYLLNERQAMFLGMKFRTSARKPNDPVLLFQIKLVNDFAKYKRYILNLHIQAKDPNRQITRDDGKITRRSSTNVMAQYKEYGIVQGASKKWQDFCYSTLTSCINRNMFKCDGKYKNLRDVMTVMQLLDVKCCDAMIEKALLQGMNEGLPYKDIYHKLVKPKMEAFAEMTGKSEILDKQLSLEPIEVQKQINQ